MAKEKKRGRSRVVLWTVLAVVVFAVAVVVGMVVFSRKGMDLQQLTGIRNLVQKPAAPAPQEQSPAPAEAAPGARSHVVQEGETLWSIAKNARLVKSPWEWRTIVSQNRDKIEYAFLTVETGEWKVMMAAGTELVVHDEPAPPPPTTVAKKYAIQIMTVPLSQREQAQKVVQMLLGEKVYAFMYRSEENGKPSYRVRAGFYESEEEAKAAAQAIRARHAEKNLFPEEFWVTLSSDRELRGDLLEFGAQRVHPWLIELPPRSTQGEALEDVRGLAGINDFLYIAQKPGHATARYVYAARIGFFATAEEARALVTAHRERLPLLGKGEVIAPPTFAEVLPGQRFKVLGGGT